jgi:hypothetical protein
MKSTSKLLALALATLGLAGTASAEIWKDYEPSKAIWNVTMVKVDPNNIDDYLMGLKQSWATTCNAGKAAGAVEDCFIYVSETDASSPFNVMLVQKFTDAAMREPSAEKYAKVMDAVRKTISEAKADELVKGYNEYRTFVGELNFRRVEFK